MAEVLTGVVTEAATEVDLEVDTEEVSAEDLEVDTEEALVEDLEVDLGVDSEVELEVDSEVELEYRKLRLQLTQSILLSQSRCHSRTPSQSIVQFQFR